jgi:hypothetical protein
VTERKSILLRLDPAVHDARARWANDELRSTNAQIEFLIRRALTDAGRMPGNAGGMRPRGRPRAADTALSHNVRWCFPTARVRAARGWVGQTSIVIVHGLFIAGIDEMTSSGPADASR